jgi:hypothetical protein
MMLSRVTQQRFPLFQRGCPQIVPIDLQQVEGIQKKQHGRLPCCAAGQTAQRHLHCRPPLTIEIKRRGFDFADDIHYRGGSLGPIGAAPGVDADLARRFPDQQPIAVMFDFVQPFRPELAMRP